MILSTEGVRSQELEGFYLFALVLRIPSDRTALKFRAPKE